DELEADAMYRLQFYALLGFYIFTHLGDEHVHTTAKEVIIFTPYVHQYLIPLQYTIRIQAQEADKISLTLCQLEFSVVAAHHQVSIIEGKVAELELSWRIVFFLLSTP